MTVIVRSRYNIAFLYTLCRKAALLSHHKKQYVRDGSLCCCAALSAVSV